MTASPRLTRRTPPTSEKVPLMDPNVVVDPAGTVKVPGPERVPSRIRSDSVIVAEVGTFSCPVISRVPDTVKVADVERVSCPLTTRVPGPETVAGEARVRSAERVRA